jgi:hypothetical protein
MKVIYVGDASNLRRRIHQHGRGNVEGSALRKHLAKTLGYELARTRRPSGSTRVRIDAPDPRAAEQQVSDYIAGGAWRWAACTSKEEAQALQWAAIEALDPLLNRDRRASPADERLGALVAALAGAPAAPHPSADPPDSPGVYALYHDVLPG